MKITLENQYRTITLDTKSDDIDVQEVLESVISAIEGLGYGYGMVQNAIIEKALEFNNYQPLGNKDPE
jgi:hypothetical protein